MKPNKSNKEFGLIIKDDGKNITFQTKQEGFTDLQVIGLLELYRYMRLTTIAQRQCKEDSEAENER